MAFAGTWIIHIIQNFSFESYSSISESLPEFSNNNLVEKVNWWKSSIVTLDIKLSKKSEYVKKSDQPLLFGTWSLLHDQNKFDSIEF